MNTTLPSGGHVFQRKMLCKNILTKFNEDWTINMTSRVLTMFYYSNKENHSDPPLPGALFINKRTRHGYYKNKLVAGFNNKENAPSIGDHVFQRTTINVASKVKTAQASGGQIIQPSPEPLWNSAEKYVTINLTSRVTAFDDAYID
ncbi:hypothetical protein DPMN_158436 [Dreissena polymorpha]|uniref:Uncharacterized protein n=1 Tax=Dreissena polymorpha TaxID=45954 RepID=A0A9D4EMG2_DREPO|nr:hypothetical protein DPMN_158436 [Dreissena polymorpha]